MKNQTIYIHIAWCVSQYYTCRRKYFFNVKGCKNMSKNSNVVPEARDALNRFKMEAANDVGVSLKQGYNGNITAKDAGSVGGQMVKKMIESYERGMK